MYELDPIFDLMDRERVSLETAAERMEAVVKKAVKWAGAYPLGGHMDASAADEIYREGMDALDSYKKSKAGGA